MTVLITKRLRLEPFTASHLAGLFKLNSDPDVMRYLSGKPQTMEETKAAIDRVKERWLTYGFSWWSFIELASNEIIGAGCIQYLGNNPANPLEIGWRLRQDKWRQGFAAEAANCMAEFAFDMLGAEVLCAVCHQDNTKSTKVIERLGMRFRGIERWYDQETAMYNITREQYACRQLPEKVSF